MLDDYVPKTNEEDSHTEFKPSSEVEACRSMDRQTDRRRDREKNYELT
jgi:hypothetical protein